MRGRTYLLPLLEAVSHLKMHIIGQPTLGQAKKRILYLRERAYVRVVNFILAIIIYFVVLRRRYEIVRGGKLRDNCRRRLRKMSVVRYL